MQKMQYYIDTDTDKTSRNEKLKIHGKLVQIGKWPKSHNIHTILNPISFEQNVLLY